jgi:hypothetical protein
MHARSSFLRIILKFYMLGWAGLVFYLVHIIQMLRLQKLFACVGCVRDASAFS